MFPTVALVIASGLGDLFIFRFDSAMVNSSYNKGKFVTVDTSSGSVIFLSLFSAHIFLFV